MDQSVSRKKPLIPAKKLQRITPIRPYVYACRIIKDQFPDTPEGNLMFAVIEQAIKDLRHRRERAGAERYLRGQIVHAQLCKVDPGWIRRVLSETGVMREA